MAKDAFYPVPGGKVHFTPSLMALPGGAVPGGKMHIPPSQVTPGGKMHFTPSLVAKCILI